jgi:hypothetical protein
MVMNPLALRYAIRLLHMRYPVVKKMLFWDTVFARTLQTIPETIVTDGAAEDTGGDWRKTLDKYRIQDK